MKILQTYWNANKSQAIFKSCGGFLCPEIHWMAWMYSALQLRKYYVNVELYTDDEGAAFFSELDFPYTKIRTDLQNDFVQNLDSSLWAYVKLYTYSLQKEPFLHVDGDVFIWKKFDEQLLKKGIVVQSFEQGLDVYKESIAALSKQIKTLPEWINSVRHEINAYNAGILGGCDIQFIQKYAHIALEFYHDNLNMLKAVSAECKHINVLPEQLLLYSLCKSHSKEVSSFFLKPTKTNNDFSDFVDLVNVPLQTKFVHTLSDTKKKHHVCTFINHVLKTDYPDQWKKIIDYFQSRDSLSPYMRKLLNLDNHKSKKCIQSTGSDANRFSQTQSINTVLCNVVDVDFQHENNTLFQKICANDEAERNFLSKQFVNSMIEYNSWTSYTDSKYFEEEMFQDYFINISPYHQVTFSNFDMSNPCFYVNPQDYFRNSFKLNFILCYYDVSNLLCCSEVLSDVEFSLFEHLKEAPIQVKELYKLLNDKTYIRKLLKNWNSIGLVYFSDNKVDFIPQKPSVDYVKLNRNRETQLEYCLCSILSHYQITSNDKSLLCSLAINGDKSINVKQIIAVLEQLNFEAKGVKANFDSLSKVPLPAIAFVKMREYLPIYVLVTFYNREDDIVSILNPETREEEHYPKSYFEKIWDGVLVLCLPKDD